MARNKMEDLRNHLFASMERLNEEDITEEQIEKEVKKAKSLARLSDAIIDTAKLEIQYLQLTEDPESKSQLFKSVVSNGNQLIEKL